MLRKVLLACGIVSSVWYIAADILGTLRYSGYRWRDQEFSELTAQGAPTRELMLAVSVVPYTLLMLALATGLWLSAGPKKRAARSTAVGLAGYTAFGFVAGALTPMATREAMAAGQDTLRNAFHGPLTLVMDLCLMAGMGVAGTLLGKRFRAYSYGTIALLLVFAFLAGVQIPQMSQGRTTPWMGLEERVNIYATMLWVAVLATALFRAQATTTTQRLRKPTVLPQRLQDVAR